METGGAWLLTGQAILAEAADGWLVGAHATALSLLGLAVLFGALAAAEHQKAEEKLRRARGAKDVADSRSDGCQGIPPVFDLWRLVRRGDILLRLRRVYWGIAIYLSAAASMSGCRLPPSSSILAGRAPGAAVEGGACVGPDRSASVV
ncbi:hypothetical protein DFH27DRAFT_607004 [Peziza echinospora]|nr:hypothetical protein DFH27DRAFT_607004 [Peziza echinospora]